MKTKLFTATIAFLSLTACDQNAIDPVVSNTTLDYKSCLLKTAANARIAASGNFITDRAGLWSDPGTWKGGVVPTNHSSGSISLDHEVIYDGATLGADYTFNGGMNINSTGGVNFTGTTNVTIIGDVNDSTYFEVSGNLTIRNGNMNVNARALLTAQGEITFDNARGGMNGRLETPKDWNLINGSNINVNSSAHVYVGDDLKISDNAKINNDLFASCETSDFFVGDAIILSSTNAKIEGNGAIILGGNAANGDNGVGSLTLIYSHIYAVSNASYSNQVKSSKPTGPIILAKKDAQYPSRTYCENPLPVTLTLWTAKLASPNRVDFHWETTSESDSGVFTIHEIKPCQDISSAKQIISKSAKGSSSAISKYDAYTIVTEGGDYLYQLQQTDANGTQKFKLISVKVGK